MFKKACIANAAHGMEMVLKSILSLFKSCWFIVQQPSTSLSGWIQSRMNWVFKCSIIITNQNYIRGNGNCTIIPLTFRSLFRWKIHFSIVLDETDEGNEYSIKWIPSWNASCFFAYTYLSISIASPIRITASPGRLFDNR